MFTRTKKRRKVILQLLQVGIKAGSAKQTDVTDDVQILAEPNFGIANEKHIKYVKTVHRSLLRVRTRHVICQMSHWCTDHWSWCLNNRAGNGPLGRWVG